MKRTQDEMGKILEAKVIHEFDTAVQFNSFSLILINK